MTGWHPVATTGDAAPRHVFRGQLLDRELAVWRADDGFVNVWENRCLHRGVRLSIGINDGAELTCRYHGWRYANRSGGCTYIPAHPADSPARTISATGYPAIERYGLIWTNLDGDDSGQVPAVAELSDDAFVLRGLPVRAPAGSVLDGLAQLRFAPTDAIERGDAFADDPSTLEPHIVRHDGRVVSTVEVDGRSSAVVFFVQPVDAGRCVIRPVLAGTPTDPVAVWRHHVEQLRRYVSDIGQAAFAAVPEAAAPLLESPVVLPTTERSPGLAGPIGATVSRTWATADQIRGIELVAADGSTLPTFQAGDHIDVHLPGDITRQYSITNAPGETDRYRLGVKLEPETRGGSQAMHALQPGDPLAISPPRNSFPLRRNIPHTLLIAGGIGVTPILSMAQALRVMDLGVELHYFVTTPQQFAFPEVLETLDDVLHRHVGLSPAETKAELADLLARPVPTTQVYACGPPPMLDTIGQLATQLGWPDDAVRFEYFENTNEIDQFSSFVVELARSALTLDVAAGETLLDVLRANGVSVTSSCEQGACGTCAVPVLHGEPLHQDVYLGRAERERGDVLLSCVSRALSERLVLDL